MTIYLIVTAEGLAEVRQELAAGDRLYLNAGLGYADLLAFCRQRQVEVEVHPTAIPLDRDRPLCDLADQLAARFPRTELLVEYP